MCFLTSATSRKKICRSKAIANQDVVQHLDLGDVCIGIDVPFKFAILDAARRDQDVLGHQLALDIHQAHVIGGQLFWIHVSQNPSQFFHRKLRARLRPEWPATCFEVHSRQCHTVPAHPFRDWKPLPGKAGTDAVGSKGMTMGGIVPGGR